MVDPEGPQMTSQYGAYKLHAGISKGYMHVRAWTLPRAWAHAGRAREHTRANM